VSEAVECEADGFDKHLNVGFANEVTVKSGDDESSNKTRDSDLAGVDGNCPAVRGNALVVDEGEDEVVAVGINALDDGKE
jgi:hypothetical protein